MIPGYTVRPAPKRPDLAASWDAAEWRCADELRIANFRPEGSGHRPPTAARLLYDSSRLYGSFRVEDRYVRSVRTRYGEPVYKDSCVEFFVQPVPGRGYFNFEFNAGGTLLASHVLDPTRTPGGFRSFAPIPETDAVGVLVRSSLPRVVEPEREDALTWTLSFSIPFELLRAYGGGSAPGPGTEWRGNFYKCGDETSHPHWGSWSPVDELNFHLPRCFGQLRFEG